MCPVCARRMAFAVPQTSSWSKQAQHDQTQPRVVPALLQKPPRQRSKQSQAVTCRALPGLLQPEAVQPVFTAFNTVLLPPWVLMIVAPQAAFTKSVIRSNVPMGIFALMFAYMFIAATAQSVSQGNDIGEQVLFLFTEATADPQKMAQMSEAAPSYAAQDWAHLCTWDYFVGQWIWEKGLEKRVPTNISLLLTFNSGPFGLLSHWVIEKVTLSRRGDPDSMQSKIEETRRIKAEWEAQQQQKEEGSSQRQ